MPTKRKELQRNLHHFDIYTLVSQVKQGDVDMSPPYQRGLVWSLDQKQKLIDSIFWGIALPALYYRELNIEATGHWLEILDGKQRLNTLVEFLDDGFEFEGQLFSQFARGDQWKIRNTVVPSIRVTGLSNDDTAELYNRINFCGVPHVNP